MSRRGEGRCRLSLWAESNPKLQIPNPNHSQRPTPKVNSQRPTPKATSQLPNSSRPAPRNLSSLEIGGWDFELGFGAWEWLELGAWDLGFDPYNISMLFGPPSPDLMPGALNAVGICLAIQPGERVALIADEASGAVAASLEAALTQHEARTETVLIESVSSRPMLSAPARVLEALERADAGILCVQPQEGELPARMAIVGLVERRRIRYAHMIGVTPQIMREGLRADYRLVDRLSQQLCERMRTATRLTVKTPAGTDFIATFDPSLVWVKTSGLINPRYWSNLPAGEVFTTPASVDGTFVCDGTAGDYFNAKYGSLEDRKSVV